MTTRRRLGKVRSLPLIPPPILPPPEDSQWPFELVIVNPKEFKAGRRMLPDGIIKGLTRCVLATRRCNKPFAASASIFQTGICEITRHRVRGWYMLCGSPNKPEFG